MKNQVDYSAAANDDLDRLRAAATDPAEVDRAADQVDRCLAWYDPRVDPDITTNCGAVDLQPGQLAAPHFTARSVVVSPLKCYFEVDDRVPPFIVTVVRVRWDLTATP